MDFGFENFNICVSLDVSSCHLSSCIGFKPQRLRVIDVQPHRNLFKVQDDVRSILDNSLDWREFM